MTNLERADRIMRIATMAGPYPEAERNETWRRAQIAMELHHAKVTLLHDFGKKLGAMIIEDAHVMAGE